MAEPCDFDPTQPPYNAMGMFHCLWCGEMVLGMFPHPDYVAMDDPNWEGWKELDRLNAEHAQKYPDDDDIGF